MLDTGTYGQLYKQADGGAFTSIGGSYDDEAWASCVQSKGKAYIYNGVDNLSYVTLSTDAITTYNALSTPGAPTPTKTGMTGSNVTHYYKITANNAVGESIASSAGSTTSNKYRDSWIDGTDFMTVTWSTVTDATSYTVYYGTSAADCNELFTVDGNATTTFIDYGTIAVNPYKLAPEGNSTQGAVFTWMYTDTKNSQIFGISTDNKLYYSAPGTGDFSPYNGGGWVGINSDGDTTLNYVDGFRNGKGDPVITVSARGAAGSGKLYHVSFETLTVGDTTIVYPNVYEANGQAGTYAPRATIKERDALWYPTGQDFKTTGTSQNVMNILTTNSISQGIEPDVSRISIENLHKAVAVAWREKIYFALPVGSTENNEIWVLDLTRKNLWILRWTVAAKDMWLYEDNSGVAHFCVLQNNVVLEFTRTGAQTHQDDGVAWLSRIGFSSLVWDEDGIILAKIRNQYFKILDPKGVITASATAYNRQGISTAAGSDTFTVTTTPTGYDAWIYDSYMYDEDPGVIESFGKPVTVLTVKPTGLVSQLDWSVSGDTAGTDYILSAVQTRGQALDQLIIKA